MFKKLSIACIFAAVLSVLAHSVVPHHEHGEILCFEQIHDNESAAQDNCMNDTHACCFDKQDAVRLEPRGSINLVGYAVCCAHCFLSALVPVELTEKPYLNLYASAALTPLRTLRGPPLL
ncbi:MAG: hypothetical protein LBR34_08595 [Prevotella sp.]|nr:hypothetical protein [Prevotella sp.]